MVFWRPSVQVMERSMNGHWFVSIVLVVGWGCGAAGGKDGDTSSTPSSSPVADTASNVEDSGSPPDPPDTSIPPDPPPDERLELTWSMTGPAPARELRHASIAPDDPRRAYLASARSGLFASTMIVDGFLRIPIAKHFYTPVLIPNQDLDTRLVGGGSYFWHSRDAAVSWEKRTPVGPDVEADVWMTTDTVTGLVADETRVVLTDSQGRVWVSTDVAESFTHVGTVPLSVGEKTKHGEDGDVAFWSVKGTRALLLSETNMLVAWDGGSVFRSEDAGVTWEEVLEGRAHRNALVAAGGIVYVGMEDGVYLSDDGGRTFGRDEASPPECYGLSAVGRTMALACGGELWMHRGGEYVFVASEEEVHSVAVAPSDSTHVVVGMLEGMMWSMDGGDTFTVESKGLDVRDLYVIASHPNEPDTMLVGTTCSTGLYQSSDRGDTWQSVPTEAHYTMLIRYAPSDANRVYVTNSPLPSRGNLLRSEDAGASFVVLEIPAGETNHPHALAVHPDNADVLLIGNSNDEPSEEYPPRMYRSEDAGETWVQVGGGFSDGFKAFLALEYDPSDASVVFAGTGPGDTEHGSAAAEGEDAIGSGDGLWVSRDGAENFSRVEGGMQGTQIWDVEFAPWGDVFATSDKGVFRSRDQGESWAQVIAMEDGERVEVAFGPADTHRVAVSAYGVLLISTDGGDDWVSHYDDANTALGPFGGNVGVTDVDFSSDGRTLYVGTKFQGVWRADVMAVEVEGDSGTAE